MHLIVRESTSLDEIGEPQDLGLDPADFILLSFSDSDLAAFRVAIKAPLILSFSPRGEGTPEAPAPLGERAAASSPSPLGERAGVRGSWALIHGIRFHFIFSMLRTARPNKKMKIAESSF